MKKFIILFAGSIAMLASCAKEVSGNIEESTSKKIRIQAGVAETRTSVNINGTTGSYSWDNSEAILVLESDSDTPRSFTNVDPQNGYFEGEADNDLIGAISPASALKEDSFLHDGTDLLYTLSLSGDYNYANGTNAILVAGSPTEVPSQTTEEPLQKFSFHHAAGLVMITYGNLPFGTAGVRFTTDKPIVGEYVLETLSDVVLTTPATGSSTAYVMLPAPISNAELNQVYSFYIPVPVNNANEHYTGIQIALVDDQKNDIPGTAKRMASKTFTVERGDIIKLPTVTLPEADVLEACYAKVTDTDDLTSGQYLIVYENNNSNNSSVAFDGSLSALDAAVNTINVVINNNLIEVTSATEAAEFMLTKNDNSWTIKSASGYYIGNTSDANALKSSTTTAYVNSISINNEDVDIVSSSTHLRYNATSSINGSTHQETGLRFRYFKSATYTGQKAIQLYKKQAAGPVGGKLAAGLQLNPAGPYSVTAGDDDSFESPVVNPNSLPLSYSFETSYTAQQEENYLSMDEDTGEILLDDEIPAGHIDVTVTFAGSSVYEAQTLSYTVNIAAPLRSIAALNALITSTETEFDVVFNNAVVTWASGNYAFIQDETAGIYVYNGAANLNEKDVLSGATTLKAKLYSGWREISAVTGAALSTLKTGTPVSELPLDEYNLEDILSDLDGEGPYLTENMRVKLSEGEYKVSGGNKYFYLDDGETRIQLFTASGVTLTCEDGDILDYVIGYPRKYGSNANDQLYIVNASEVVTRAKPVINLTNVPSGTLSISDHELTVGYSVTNPMSEGSVAASTEANWLDAEASNGEITILVDSNDGQGNTEGRTAVVTVTYPFANPQTITITQAGNSYAITYEEVTGGTLSGVSRAKPGVTVTLTAQPLTNYSFNNDWVVTPSTPGSAPISVTNNTFTMPADNVHVEGSFTYEGGSIVQGNTVTCTFTNKNLNISENNGISWSSTKSASSFETASPARGVQFGAAIGEFTLTGSGYTAGIKKISMIVSTNGTNNQNTIDVKIGTTTIGSQVKLTKNNNYEISFESSTVLAGGDIVILVNDSNKSVYFKSITINPQ